jgi:tetratricopeptide (TPR) repeat protein
MHDVFICYKGEHQERAKNIRSLLWDKGWSVFLDENLESGKRWDQQLEQRLDEAGCVLALWSKGSASSNVQFDEANYALSHGKLILARLDDERLPLGFQPIQRIELLNWTEGEHHPGIARIFASIERTIKASKAKPEPIGEIAKELSGKPDTADRHSISNRSADAEGILSVLADANPATRNAIERGYEQLSIAHKETRYSLNDDTPREHYRNAAANFRQALLDLSEEQKNRLPEEVPMPVAYFLNMELANALVFAGRNADPIPHEATDIYEQLAKQYDGDTAVWLRLGRARVKDARYASAGASKRSALQAAIRDLNKALSVAPFDRLVDAGHWVYFEAPLQIGICFWQVAEFPALPREKRIDSLSQALRHTQSVLTREMPDRDPDGFIQFIRLRAASNALYFSSLLVRDGQKSEEMVESIKNYSEQLMSDVSWPIVKNQVRIIDSLMTAAATVNNHKLAVEMGKLNLENFKKILHQRSLDADEGAMAARAEEIVFLIERFAAGGTEGANQPASAISDAALAQVPPGNKPRPLWRWLRGIAAVAFLLAAGLAFLVSLGQIHVPRIAQQFGALPQR